MISASYRLRFAAKVALCTVAIALAGWLLAHAILVARANEFRARSLLYATAVASTLPTWIARSESPDLSPLADYAVVAGLLYVQVSSGGVVLLEVAQLPGVEENLETVPKLGESYARLTSLRARPLVDVAVPYSARLPRGEAVSSSPYASGTLRLGLDASGLAWAAASVRALSVGLAALVWVAALTWVGLATRRADLRHAAQAHGPTETSGRVLGTGPLVLHVDEARWAVGGRSIRLTPKQLALVKVLMSDPGRTFSDEEILSRAWPESPYADFRDVKQCVYLVRRRLSSVGLPGDRIVANVPGVGYRVVPTSASEIVDNASDSPAIGA